MKEIIKIRAETEKIQLEDDALDELVNLADKTRNLRYALQLLTPAKILAEVDQREIVEKFDIQEASELFIDPIRSALIIKNDESGKYLT